MMSPLIVDLESFLNVVVIGLKLSRKSQKLPMLVVFCHLLTHYTPLKFFPQDFPQDCPQHFPQEFPAEFPARFSHKNLAQDFPARISRKNFP